jgi:UDP-3-O-[3-hydroxymyristoyl] glucosamine N-acyltransferase
MVSNLFYKQKISSITLADIAAKFNLELVGKNREVKGISIISKAEKEDLCFLTNKSYLFQLSNTKAESCLISKEIIDNALELNKNISYLVSDYAYDKLALVSNLFYAEIINEPKISTKSSIAKTAKLGKNTFIGDFVTISDNAEIGDNVVIEAGCYIGNNVKIGDNCKIEVNTVIKYAYIGNNVEISAGVRIGQDGFGFSYDGTKYNKLNQLGLVIIENDVSIGANCCIDRGSFDNTVIGYNTKLDNLVQIAHNVKIGKHCLLASQVGISGSTIIGDFVTCGGQVGFAGHLRIGNKNRFAGQAGVTKHIENDQGDFYGMPAKRKKEWQLQQIKLKELTNSNNKNDK